MISQPGVLVVHAMLVGRLRLVVNNSPIYLCVGDRKANASSVRWHSCFMNNDKKT